MLTRNHLISPRTDAESARPAMVATVLSLRVYAIKHLAAVLKWRTREQRARE